MIEIINAKLGLNKVFLRAEKTLVDLKKFTPEKTELIKTQKDSLNELAKAQIVLHRLDLKNMSMSGDLYRNSKLLLELQTELNELKKINKKLLENATL